MNKMMLKVTALTMIILQVACQYPVGSVKLPDPQKFLVVNAELTESYGKVQVTYTLTDVTSLGGFTIPPPPAFTSVYVLDGHGNRTDFSPDGRVDSLFHGVVGENYKLFIQVDGESYESSVETNYPNLQPRIVSGAQ
jgi:hypothetical protein